MELRHLVAPGAVDDVRVERIGGDVAVLDGPDGVPVVLGDLAVVAAAGDAHRAAFLLTGAHAIGKGRCDADVKQLRGRLVEPGAPALPAVQGHDRALVAHQRDDAGVFRADPQALVVIPAR